MYTMWGVSDALVQIWINWFLGQLSDSPQELSRLAGVYKTFNTLGNWAGSLLDGTNFLGMDYTPGSPRLQLIINCIVFAVSVPATVFVIGSSKSCEKEETLVQASP